MKTSFTLLAAIFLYLSSYTYAMDYTALALKIRDNTANELCEKYDLEVIGSGGGTMYGVETLSLAFQIQSPVSIKQARKLLLDSAKTFLDNLNSNKEIRPYLAEYPFPLSRIQLDFYIIDSDKNEMNDGLCVFGVRYYTKRNQIILDYDKTNKEMLETILEETYDEAIERVKNEENTHND